MPKKPHVNQDCIGAGTCVAIAGGVFKMNDKNIAEVLDVDYEAHKDAIDEAIEGCPVDAITWVESE